MHSVLGSKCLLFVYVCVCVIPQIKSVSSVDDNDRERQAYTLLIYDTKVRENC